MIRSSLLALLLLSCGGDIAVIEKSNSTEECESLVWYLDFDGDGFGGADAIAACEGPEGYVENNQDCDELPNSDETESHSDYDSDSGFLVMTLNSRVLVMTLKLTHSW